MAGVHEIDNGMTKEKGLHYPSRSNLPFQSCGTKPTQVDVMVLQ